MTNHAHSSDDLLDDLASCLRRVSEHIRRTNVGGLVVAAGCHLLDMNGGSGSSEDDGATVPSVVTGAETAGSGQ